jgi:putative DNA primase/helicase
MGAKKWKDTYNELLQGKHVVLIPDNDQEGREHMAQVGASLNGVAASLKLLELPDLPSKGDVSDWLVKFPDQESAAERLSMMIEGADPYEPPKQASIEDAVLDAGTLVRIEMQEKRTIIDPWLTEQSISLVSGWRGVGKTFFCMGLVDAITRAQSFGPWNCKTPVPCLYVEAEMPFPDVKERTSGLNPGQNRKVPLYIYSDAYASDLGLPRANLLSERWREKMKAILTARGIKLWVADNLASLTRGIDENSKRDWDPINQWLLELRFAGISTILPHHTNKEGGQRGTSAREDNIDISIILKSTFDYVPEDGAKFLVHFTKHRVSTNKLKDIADTQFQLTEDESDLLVWSWGNVKAETKLEVLRLLDEGHNQSDVASIVGVHKGYVSKIRKQAIKEGQMTPKNKLTQSGCGVIYGEEN